MTQRYYSPENAGFFSDDAHTLSQLPKDAFMISHEQWEQLIEAQRCGHNIVYENGVLFARKPIVTMEQIRASRDARLRRTDWTQLDDVPEATRKKWAAYRQALRDVPQNVVDPNYVDWPAMPG